MYVCYRKQWILLFRRALIGHWKIQCSSPRSDAELVVLAFQFAIVTNEEISWNKRKSCSHQHGENEKMRFGLADMFMNKLKTNSLNNCYSLLTAKVWSNNSPSNLKKLRLLQNFACKIVSNYRKYDHWCHSTFALLTQLAACQTTGVPSSRYESVLPASKLSYLGKQSEPREETLLAG